MRKLFSSLTDKELVDSIEESAQRERSVSIEILDQLAEMDRRDIHLDLGFRSLHSYCVSRLRYSESAAGRRICTARTMVKCPEIRGMIADGRLNLSTVCVLSTVLTPSNRFALLKGASGKSRREVEAIVACLKPRKRVRERITPVAFEKPSEDRMIGNEPARSPSLGVSGGGDSSRPPGAEKSPNRPANRNSTGNRPEIYLRRGGKNPTTRPARKATASLRGTRFELRFSIDQDAMAMLERARKIAPGSSTLESVFGRMLREYLDRHDPAGRQERRERRKSGQGTGNVQKTGTGKRAGNARGNGFGRRKGRSRYIPAPVRDEIFVRDGFRCTFIAADGTRCDATRHLQIDHIRPFALGGKHVPENLRLLCGAHNRVEADRRGLPAPARV